jgi:bifunctional DNA-binding transcriptional regulator/antitoxin component of YhaV-PrlF toxin-antitoxin module
MSQKQKFTATIENAGGGGAYVRVPFDVEKAFGKKRVAVLAKINGEPYRGTLVRMGEPFHMLVVLKEIRQKIGKDFGDEVEVVVEEDTQPRVVEVPVDFREALELSPVAKAVFEKMSYTHQREYVRAILAAKREETRRSRIAKSIEMLIQIKKGQ